MLVSVKMNYRCMGVRRSVMEDFNLGDHVMHICVISDSVSIKHDVLLLLDTFFHIFIFHGELVAQCHWRNQNIKLKNDSEFFRIAVVYFEVVTPAGQPLHQRSRISFNSLHIINTHLDSNDSDCALRLSLATLPKPTLTRLAEPSSFQTRRWIPSH